MANRWWRRCATAQKPGVGTVHLHRKPIARWQVDTVWFQPVQREVMYLVPFDRLPEVLAAESFEQAMVLVVRDVQRNVS